jgi:hypothetical protein
MPVLIISFVFCSSANVLAHELTGEYLWSAHFRMGQPLESED